MRILMIAPEPFLEPRGTPFSVYHRAKALVSSGYEVDLVTYHIGKPVTLEGLKIYRIPAIPFIRTVKIGPSWAKLPLDLLVFLTAVWRLCRRRYRYLHTHEEAGMMGVILAFIFGCKHLYDMHSDLSQLSNYGLTKSRLLIRVAETLQRFMIRKADAVITVYRDLEETVKRVAPGKPVYLVENAAVDEALPPADEQAVEQLRRQLGLEAHPVLVYTGTFEKYQGIEILLRSAAKVCLAFPTARYVLAGGRPDQVEKQRRLAQELGIAEMVHFVGQRPLEEMPQYMALADILLSPRSEGTNTPLKLYTYLRSGKPLLATNIFSHTQILTPSMTMLVPPTAEGLAQGALELLQDPERARALGERGRKLAEENYSWSAFLEKNRRAYRMFTASKREVLHPRGEEGEVPGLAEVMND